MSSQDALWLTMDRPNNLMVIDSLMWFEAPLALPEVQAVVQERLIERFSAFSCLAIDDGGWRWVPDEDFDLSAHVTQVELPSQGDMVALQEFVAAQRSLPLDRARPLWSLTVLQGFRPAPDVLGSAVLIRSHHAIADGIRLTQVMFSLCDADGQPPSVGKPMRRPTPLAVAASTVGELASSAADVVTSTARTTGRVAAAPVRGIAAAAADPSTLLSAPGTVATGLRDIAGRAAAAVRNPARLTDAATLVSSRDNRPVNDVSSAAKLLLASPSGQAVWGGTPGVPKSVGWTPELDLDQVKKIGKATGTTVNDVLLGVISGTLTSYLRQHDDEGVDEVVWMIPVSVRPFDPELSDDLGNHFSLVAYRLPLGIDDVTERLAEIQRRMERIKASDEPLLTYGVQLVISQAPTPVATGLTNFFANKAVGVLTNVPGPRGPISFAGQRVAGVLGWAPCSGDQIMTICIFSYNGRVSIGIATDTAHIPDAQQLGELFATEFADMISRFG